jgi:hypothetical protein
MLFDIPAAVSLGLFFVPPIFIDMAVGLLLAWLVARVLNRTGAQPLLLASAARVPGARDPDEFPVRYSRAAALSP